MRDRVVLEGTLERVAARRRRQGLHARCRGRRFGVCCWSGARLWTASVTPENEKSSGRFGGGVALDGGQLYATTGYGTVVALNPGNGAIIWTKRTGEPIRSSPTAAGGKIYFVSTDNVLHCLSATDGAEVWTARGLPQPATLLSNVSPAVGKGFVIAPFAGGRHRRLSEWTGRGPGRIRCRGRARHRAAGVLGDPARPVIDQGVVFAVSHGGKMIASSETTGERLWTRTLPARKCRGSRAIRSMSSMSPASCWRSRVPTEDPLEGRSARERPLERPVLAGGKVWAVSARRPPGRCRCQNRSRCRARSISALRFMFRRCRRTAACIFCQTTPA